MAPRIGRRPFVFRTLALLAGLSGSAAEADPLYTVTNLGSTAGVTFTTASGGTMSWPSSNATNQLASVTNGQVSYSFATTPDSLLFQGQVPLSGIPAGLNPDPAIYGNPEVAGLLNPNGLAALAVSLSFSEFPSSTYSTAYVVPLNSGGTLAWGQGATIMSTPGNGPTGQITIAGINTANEVLLGGEIHDFAVQRCTGLQHQHGYAH